MYTVYYIYIYVYLSVVPKVRTVVITLVIFSLYSPLSVRYFHFDAYVTRSDVSDPNSGLMSDQNRLWIT